MVALQLLQLYKLKLSHVLLTEKEPIYTGILHDDTRVKNRALAKNASYQSIVLILHYFQVILKNPHIFQVHFLWVKKEKVYTISIK